MNELSVEEKAQRYDEAIEVINKCETDKYGCIIGVKPTDIFPELKESEDEMIRKSLAAFFAKFKPDDMWDADFSFGDIVAWIEKQGEQKTTENAEPKFEVGDWTVSKLDGKARQILGVHHDRYNNYYVVEDNEYNINEYDRLHHHWTIKDAKDGDVLSFNDGHGNDCIELIKSITGKKIEFWFCLTNSNRYEVFDGNLPYTNIASRKDATPATKEQRDLLFAKMKEAGYEWDAEKKELKKIEQKVAWSEEDEKMLDTVIDDFVKLAGPKVCYYKDVDWLNSLKKKLKEKLGIIKNEHRIPTFDDAVKYGKNIVLTELERIVKEKEEAGKNYVFVFSEVKDLVEKMSQKG